GEVVDVEEPAVADIAGSQPPVRELVVLALEQMMQCRCLRWSVGSRSISLKTPIDDIRRFVKARQFFLEVWCLCPVGPPQTFVSRRNADQLLPGGCLGRAGLTHDHAQDLAVALGPDRQFVFKVPGREATR